MDTQHIVLFTAVIAAVVVLILVVRANVRSARLHRSFETAGSLRGRTLSEIVARVGPPTSVNAAGQGRAHLHWMAAGFRIVVVFNGEICEGVLHQANA